MADDVVIRARADHVLEIELNRPGEGNALTPAMAQVIAAALARIDPETRVVLLRAAGPDFCTGRASALPLAMPPTGARPSALDLRRAISDPVLDFYQALRGVPVPLVACVQGRAAGAGCAIAALADVAVAAADARFQVPEMNHDIAPTLVMNALSDRIPRAALARLVLTRDAVDAAEAKALGLVGAVVPAVALEAEGERIVGQLAKNSVATVRAVKTYLAVAPETSFASRKELAALLNATATAERFR